MDGTIAQPRPFLALGLRLATAFSLATMAMLVKLAGEHSVHLFELMFWRQAITLPLVLGVMAATGRLARLRTRRPIAHLARSLIGITSMAFVYGAVMLLPLAEATTLSFTTPLFAVMISRIFFRERIGAFRWSAVTLGFIGIVVALQPGNAAGGINPVGIAVGLIAAIMVAVISFQVQDLNRTESPYAIVAWFTGLTAPLMALSLPFVGSSHDATTWMIIFAMALAGAIAQLLLTASLRYGSAATIIIMDYTALIWATAYGWMVFGQVPPATLAVGAPLIVAAGIVIAWREHRLSRARVVTGTLPPESS